MVLTECLFTAHVGVDLAGKPSCASRATLTSLQRLSGMLDLGDGRKLLVVRWLELLGFPWHPEKKEGGDIGKEAAAQDMLTQHPAQVKITKL